MRHFVRDAIGISCLMALVVIFFARLFIPTVQLIVTPDFGRSDAWHFSFATKFALSEALKSGHLPLWQKDIGGGFPLFAEGQTGALYLPNLILFSTFSEVTAYNLALAVTFIMFALGMYWWMRTIGCSVIAAVFASVTITFSALPVLQLTHLTLLQGMSMLPIVGVLTYLLISRGPFPWMSLLALALSQQIFAGFPQATLLTALFAGSYALFLSYTQKRKGSIVWFILGYFLAISMGAVQLLASVEFLRASSNPTGFDGSSASYFSFPVRHLVTFLAPFALGNPKNGSYPPFFQFDGSIFWENTAYVGLLPLFLLLYGFFRERKNPEIRFFLWIIGVSLLLSWGKYSPFYFIFSFPPLNLFRVPSRFLWLVITGVAVIAAKSIDTLHARSGLMRTEILLTALVLLQIGQLFSTFWSYHMMVPAASFMTPPLITSVPLKGKVYTIGESVLHNASFLPHGWQQTNVFQALREGVSPNSNVLWHIPQQEVYAGRFLRRQTLTDQLLTTSITVGDTAATFSATTQTYLNLFSVGNIISFLPLTQTTLTPVKHLQQDTVSLDIYENPTALARAYLVYEATKAATLVEAKRIFEDPSFAPGETVLLESHEVDLDTNLAAFTQKAAQTVTDRPATPTIIKDTDEEVKIRTNAAHPAILVLTDTYYPGWQADVDGIPARIVAANISERAVMVSQGTHTVTFSYRPKTVTRGLLITILMTLVTAGLMVVPIGVAASRTHYKARLPEQHL